VDQAEHRARGYIARNSIASRLASIPKSLHESLTNPLGKLERLVVLGLIRSVPKEVLDCASESNGASSMNPKRPVDTSEGNFDVV